MSSELVTYLYKVAGASKQGVPRKSSVPARCELRRIRFPCQWPPPGPPSPGRKAFGRSGRDFGVFWRPERGMMCDGERKANGIFGKFEGRHEETTFLLVGCRGTRF